MNFCVLRRRVQAVAKLPFILTKITISKPFQSYSLLFSSLKFFVPSLEYGLFALYRFAAFVMDISQGLILPFN